MDYWVGVFTGFMCSLLFMGVVCFGVTDRMRQYEAALEQLNKKEAELQELYAEHEKIMRAYEFYNWQYSLKMDKEE